MALCAINVALQTSTAPSSRECPRRSVVDPQLRFFRRSRTSSYRLELIRGRRSIRNVSVVSNLSVSATPVDFDLLEVGTILTTHGIKGELKVEAHTDFPEERLTVAGKRWLQAGAAEPKEYYLERGRPTVSKGHDIWIVKLQGVDSLNDSQSLRGQTLLVDRSDRPELEDEDEFLTQDLIGASVVLQQDGSCIGTVMDIYDGTGPGAHDFLNIMLSDDILQSKSRSKTMLLPFVKDFVPHINIEDNVIHISPPAGLVDMALNPTVKSKIAVKKATGTQA